MRSGFVTLVGRPNVGKSTLLNPILGTKVSIVSDKPQTTRTQVRGVLNRPDAQIVFVDTPGIHKPRTLLGERLNDIGHRRHRRRRRRVPAWSTPPRRSARATASSPSGCRATPSSWSTRSTSPRPTRCWPSWRAAAEQLDLDEYFPVSARPATACDALVDAPRRAACPRARSTTPTTWSPTCPRRSGWPSWCASSCSRSPATSCRTRSPPGSPSGSGRASAARSSSSATRRRAS